ncbi:MAG: PIN domain-containing protein, partial [Sphingobacteriaceae bacterium]
MVMFDTSVLIELYRGNQLVKDKIAAIGSEVFYRSNITVAEFLIGARDKSDLIKIKKHLDNYVTLDINEAISAIFIKNFKEFSLSHRPGIADMLIAATSLYYN